MHLTQRKWTRTAGWMPSAPAASEKPIDLILAFGATQVLQEPKLLSELAAAHPGACLAGCSTSGEILSTQVSDDSLTVTEISFSHSGVRTAMIDLSEVAGSREAGLKLAGELPAKVPAKEGGEDEPLVHAFVLSDGLSVNGSDLVRGLTEGLPEGVTLSGGLAGDGTRFSETLVICCGKPHAHSIVLIGFYGSKLKFGCASLGGWDSFGPERLITRSKGNVLYEMDGQSVLGLYKRYLGEHAKELPASGLHFPLSLRTSETETAVVRTILAIDEKAQSITFAGDVPEGAYARMMKANFDRLIDGAVGAAERGFKYIGSLSPDFAILISCVGRKLVLRQRVEEEIEGVRDVLGQKTVLCGFYSYGEISPFTQGARCELHNQTMTITVISEQ